MATTTGHIRYQPDQKPGAALSLGLGLQLAAIHIVPMVLMPMAIIRAAGESETYLSWALFAAVVVCGATTALQATRVGRVGAGYVLIMNISGAAIAVCVAALSEGGPALLATLLVVSSFVPLIFSIRIALFRRILTPTVSGTVMILVPVTVMPIVFPMLTDVPQASPVQSAPVSALVTILVIIGIALKGTTAIRPWGPLIGIGAGTVVGGWFGLYDLEHVAAASWTGFPKAGWPGLDLEFGPAFWSLLPAFILVALIRTVLSMSAAIGIQHVSWRQARSVDLRAVSGSLMALGLGNLLAGVAGTTPNTARNNSVAMTELTGVASRSVGIAAGLALVVLAFFPKAIAVILAIPSPVIAAYLIVSLSMLFMLGMKIIIHEIATRNGHDYRQRIIAGVSFWLGVGFQNGVIFPEYTLEFAGGLLSNGMTAGGLIAIFLTLFLELAKPRRRRIEEEFDLSVLPKLREFLGEFASRHGWDSALAQRLDAVTEETLLTLTRQYKDEEQQECRRLLLVAGREEADAVLEFVVAAGKDNIEDQLSVLDERIDEIPGEREVSLRLLRHHSSSVRHQQYHDMDIVTVRVTGSSGPVSGRPA